MFVVMVAAFGVALRRRPVCRVYVIIEDGEYRDLNFSCLRSRRCDAQILQSDAILHISKCLPDQSRHA